MRRLVCILAVATCLTGTVACSSTTYHGGWCAFHAYRLVHDIRTHHRGFAALQAVLAAHQCSQALRSLRQHR